MGAMTASYKRIMRRATVFACAGLAILLLTHSSARATTVTAQSGDVTATFSYAGRQIPYRDLRLTISQSGHVLYNQLVASSSCAQYCSPGALGPHQSALRVLDLESDGQPDVALALFTGGAHCCFVDQVYSYDPGTMTYAKTEQDFQNSGADLRQVNGRYVFVSANNDFYYKYASFAYSGAPIQIFRFSGGRFLDHTRSYPSLIKADAALWWKAFTHSYSQGEGLIAPWAADEYLLNKMALVNSTLQTELRQNHLRSGGFPGVPSGKKFIAALKKFLIAQGYAR